VAVIACSWEMVDVRVLIDTNDRRSGTAPAPTRLRSTLCSQQTERLAAATETVNPIASAPEKAQEPALVRPDRSRLGERLSLMRAAPGRLSGTAAKLRRLLFPLLLRLATAPRIGWSTRS
jgi:hypothetical protein